MFIPVRLQRVTRIMKRLFGRELKQLKQKKIGYSSSTNLLQKNTVLLLLSLLSSSRQGCFNFFTNRLLKYLLQGSDTAVLNLGNGNGFSVKQVIETAEKVTARNIKVVESDRRPKNPPILVGSSDKARKLLGWEPQHPVLQEIISHAWQWHQHRHC